MDPTFISAGASLLGGFLGDRQRKKDQRYNERMIAQQNAYNAPDQIRARAEKAGFNPLLFAGPGVGLQTSAPQAVGGNYLGAAIADAGMMAADALARQPARQKLNQFQAENQKLKQQVQSLTLRPKVGGLYADRVVTPSIKTAVGRSGKSDAKTGLDPRIADPVNLADGGDGGIAVPEPRLDRGAGIFLGGNYWESAPGWSTGQTIEDEYGDVASWAYGIGKIAADTGHNARRFTNAMGWSDPNTWGGFKPKSLPKRKLRTYPAPLQVGAYALQ